jgi:tRNA-Thr(GGU) m(6)t(6)A37 methyltransferase TsaA
MGNIDLGEIVYTGGWRTNAISILQKLNNQKLFMKNLFIFNKGVTMSSIVVTPIGTVHSPFQTPAGTPIQPAAAEAVTGTVVLEPQYVPGLDGLDGFSHIVLLTYFHLAKPYRLHVTPFLDDTERGLFATRAPSRPNPIGLSVVELLRIEGATLHIRGVDIVDGTPLLDLKPYVPAFDRPDQVRVGWLSDRLDALPERRDDGRFVDEA